MARIAGIDLPKNKRLVVALTYIYGIGVSTAEEIMKKAGFDNALRTQDLTEEQTVKLRDIIDGDFKVEGDLRRDIGLSIKRLMDIG